MSTKLRMFSMTQTRTSKSPRMVGIFIAVFSLEHLFYYQAFKPEEKKILNHLKFEQITSKYW